MSSKVPRKASGPADTWLFASLSTKPTIWTPSSSWAWSSRASASAAVPVPTSSRRSRGPTCRATHAKPRRQPISAVTASVAAGASTPRATISAGNNV